MKNVDRPWIHQSAAVFGVWASKVLLDVFVVGYPDRTLLREGFRPGQCRILEAALENKELALLLERVAGLYQSAGGLPGFHNNRRFREGGHGHVALGEEVAIRPHVLPGIPNNGHLTDYQVIVGNRLL